MMRAKGDEDMDYIVNITGAGSFPQHTHDQYEIICYTGGGGVMRTRERQYPVAAGTILIVPPGVSHGSFGEGEIERIYIRGEFRQSFSFTEPVLLRDNDRGEGMRLAQLLYENRFDNNEYLHALCNAFVRFLLMHMEVEDSLGHAVNEVVSHLTHHFADADLNVGEVLRGSGYAEDYIRAHFRRITGRTPVEFLTDVRIRHACFLMEFYGGVLTMAQIAEQCGYTDYVYFSKKFKALAGLSPRAYRAALETGAF